MADKLQAATFGGVIVLGVLSTLELVEVVRLSATIRNAINAREGLMQTVECDVTRPDGSVQHITTAREKTSDGGWEPVATWGARHQEAIDYWKTH